MLMDLRALMRQHHFQPRNILHVGAHHAEEAYLYKRIGAKNVWWVEADPSSFELLPAILKTFPGQIPVHAAVSDRVEETTFNLANNGESSSLLDFGTHSTEHPEVVFTDRITVRTTTIDDLLADGVIGECDFMNLDIQGMELRALQGATMFIDSVEAIYTEVNEKKLYVDCGLIGELDAFLADHGFSRTDTSITRHGWGDALYLRTV